MNDVPQEMKWSPEEEKLLKDVLNKCVCAERYQDKDIKCISGWDCPKHKKVKRFMYELGLREPIRITNHSSGMTILHLFCPHCGKDVEFSCSINCSPVIR